MPRVRGGRGFRGRGRRGRYDGGPKGGQNYVNSPTPNSLPASTHCNSPQNPPGFGFHSGSVPIKENTVNIGQQQAPPSLTKLSFIPQSSNVQTSSPANVWGETPTGVIAAQPCQDTPANAAPNMTTGSMQSQTEDNDLKLNPEFGGSVETDCQNQSSVSVRDTEDQQKALVGFAGSSMYEPNDGKGSQQESVLGKRKEPPSSTYEITNGDADGKKENANIERQKDGRKKSKLVVAGPTPDLTPEVIMEINEKVIGTVKNSEASDMFVCLLCLAQINSKRNLEKHLGANEHMRRVGCLQSPPSGNFFHFCETCYVTCLNEEVYSTHVKGKKHAKNVQLSSKINSLVVIPVGESLKELLKKEVVKSGDGLSLGLSQHMMKFFTMEGPFIGLQYAEEVGVENDPNPGYHCSLCNITIDGGNQSLHFTSTAHRMNVLKKDYPNEYAVAKAVMDKADKKSELSVKLKEICSEIESKDGRKVELIKRVIVSTKFNKGFNKGTNYCASPYGGYAVSGSDSLRGGGTSSRRGSFATGRGNFQQQKGKGKHFSPSTPGSSKQPNQRDHFRDSAGTSRGRGGFGNRGRGRYGEVTRDDYSIGSQSDYGYSSFGSEKPQPLFPDSSATTRVSHSQFSERRRDSSDSQRGRRDNMGHQQQNQPWSPTNPPHIRGVNPNVPPPLQFNVNPPHPSSSLHQLQGQSPSPMYGAILNTPPSASSMPPPTVPPISSPLPLMPGTAGQSLHSPMNRFPPTINQNSPTSPWPLPPRPPHLPPPPQPPPMQPPQYGQQYRQALYHDAGGRTTGDSSATIGTPQTTSHSQASDALKVLEGAVIDSEEDAEQALRLSSALTQKLLAYRFKTVSSTNPIMSLLNTLQASGLQPPPP